MQNKLRQLANYDGLTQIYNRTYFIEESLNLLRSLRSKGDSFSIIMFDIDYFKRVNDTYGHVAGDKVLSFVANLVKSTLREKDLFARYGGEEFIILLPETDSDVANELAIGIGKIVSERSIVINENAIHVTLSLGVSSTIIKQGDMKIPLQTAINEADHALYTAKRNGRNNVQQFEKELQCL